MAEGGKRGGARPPKFPRRRWTPGQRERIEPPARGGPYDRARQRRETDEAIADALEGEEGGPSEEPPSEEPPPEEPGPEAPRGRRGRRR